MSSTATNPVIRRAGAAPSTPRKLFVNLPVGDLQRSITFFEALGFDFNPHFTDHTATCMLVGEDAYVMLLTEDKFREFSQRPIGDRRKETNTILAYAVPSRAEVDRAVETAVAAGGTRAGDPQDLGFMYNATFRDPDGYNWEPFWMDPAATGDQ
ncbi:MAG TPA: VOC family protein [Gemmatimonadales bacterium]|nr:VOC family protein [Gemmatimonadales bacterium]